MRKSAARGPAKSTPKVAQKFLIIAEADPVMGDFERQGNGVSRFGHLEIYPYMYLKMKNDNIRLFWGLSKLIGKKCVELTTKNEVRYVAHE